MVGRSTTKEGYHVLRGVALSGVLLGLAAAVSLQAARVGPTAPVGSGQPAAPPTQRAVATAPAAVESQRALLDQYCVACHNDRTRQAGLTLETIDTDQVGPGRGRCRGLGESGPEAPGARDAASRPPTT